MPTDTLTDTDHLPASAADAESLGLLAPASTEIDAREVVRHFRKPRRAVPPRDPGGYDCAVVPVDPADRRTIEVTACPVCGCSKATPVFAIEGLVFRVVTCLDCGLGHLHPRPDAEMVGRFYPAEYYGCSGAKFGPAIETAVRLLGARQARWLTCGLAGGGRILDVGCGRGVLLGALADRGHEVHGFEISPTAANGADRRAEIRIAPRLTEADYPDEHFDRVVLWHVLEHLPDPRETLLEIRRVLKPGGKLAVAVPNFSSLQARWAGAAWFHLDLPRHLFHFPLPALRRLLWECGFLCESEHHFSLRQNPFGWIQSALNLASLPRNALYAALKRSTGPRRAGLGRTLELRMKLACLAGAPLALGASALAAALRKGATVSLMALKP